MSYSRTRELQMANDKHALLRANLKQLRLLVVQFQLAQLCGAQSRSVNVCHSGRLDPVGDYGIYVLKSLKGDSLIAPC